MYVALEAESNTISPSEMNRSEGTSLNFYANYRRAHSQSGLFRLCWRRSLANEITRGLLIRCVVRENRLADEG